MRRTRRTRQDSPGVTHSNHNEWTYARVCLRRCLPYRIARALASPGKIAKLSTSRSASTWRNKYYIIRVRTFARAQVNRTGAEVWAETFFANKLSGLIELNGNVCVGCDLAIWMQCRTWWCVCSGTGCKASASSKNVRNNYNYIEMCESHLIILIRLGIDRIWIITNYWSV